MHERRSGCDLKAPSRAALMKAAAFRHSSYPNLNASTSYLQQIAKTAAGGTPNSWMTSWVLYSATSAARSHMSKR
jgi:hypothetical protein